jgi:hypothetical protein
MGQNGSVSTTKWFTLGRLSFGNIQVRAAPGRPWGAVHPAGPCS